MDKIKKALANLDPESIEHLKDILDIKQKSGGNSAILSKLCHLHGINSILTSLSENELQLFSFIAKHQNGVTFGEIEKNLHIKHEKIEELSEKLKNKLLIYIFKNRKHLTKKLDKILIFSPIFDLLNIVDSKSIVDKIKIYTEIIHNNFNKKLTNTNKITDPQNLLKTIFSKDGILTLNELLETFPIKKINEFLINNLNNNNIEVLHYTNYPFNTFIILKKDAFKYFLSKSKKENVTLKIKNHYLLLNNLLQTYDIISSYGLYLTQQNEFRKIDRKKINDSISPIFDHDGREITREETSQFCLYILNLLETITLKKNSVFVSLTNLKDHLSSPSEILHILLKNFTNNNVKIDNLFNPPFRIPDKDSFKLIIDLFIKSEKINPEVLQKIFFIKKIINNDQALNRLSEKRIIYFENFEDSIRFLLFFGIINYEDGNYILSDIGKTLFLKISSEKKPNVQINEKNIYINPDFTLMIPKEEISSKTLYSLLAYTEIIKNDIILHTQITKESILKAYKRGMNIEKFISILNETAKNDIPQNLSFLLKDWIEQTLTLNINYVTILKTNHASFFEEILYGPLKSCIVERISDNYAIINREYLDEITKIAESKNAIISIMGDID